MTDTIVLERPLLLRTAEPRTEGEALPGRYCPDAAVWVVDTNQGAKPIVEIGGTALNETQTKTMSQVEADDDDSDFASALDTGTYTKVTGETDDEDASMHLPELLTKTDVQQERDDQIDPLV